MEHSAHHHGFSRFPHPLATAVAAIIAMAIGFGAYLLTSGTRTSTVVTPPVATRATQTVSPELRGVLERSHVRVLYPSQPPF